MSDLLAFDADAARDNRPALLLVHGLLSSRNHWLPNMAGLRSRLRCVRVELPGHGGSKAPTDRAMYAPDALVRMLDAVRQHLNIGAWAVLGQSLGAALTLRYALTHPDVVHAQVFTNSIRPFLAMTSEQVAAEQAARYAALRDEGRNALRKERFHPRFARRFPPDLRELLARDADAVQIDAMLGLIGTTMPHLSIRSRVAQTRCPTLLVNGTLERAFQPVREHLPQLMPGLRIVDLPGGHSINIEHPVAFDQAVLDFLS